MAVPLNHYFTLTDIMEGVIRKAKLHLNITTIKWHFTRKEVFYIWKLVIKVYSQHYKYITRLLIIYFVMSRFVIL